MSDNKDLEIQLLRQQLASAQEELLRAQIMLNNGQNTPSETDKIQLFIRKIASSSSELRTPINSIIGFADVILKGIDGPLTDFQTKDLTTIRDSGQQVLALIDELIDEAKGLAD